MPVQLNDVVISSAEVMDVRFPTSDEMHGSDAIHVDPDYSAVYVRLYTNHGIEGNGLAFTCGRGTEIGCLAAKAYLAHVTGQSLSSITGQFGRFWHSLANESQLRWLGPQKGITHMAMAAVINAIWDLWAKVENKPIWQLVCDMSPETLVGCLDFSWVTDCITPDEAVALLTEKRVGQEERIQVMAKKGYPAYTTSVGWMGYSDDTIRQRCKKAMEQGWNHFKVKVGKDCLDNIRRCALIRDLIGPDRHLMIDANQVWEVNEAIEMVAPLKTYDLLWVEEPTCPDDVLGHQAIARGVAPIAVATGEACQNRVVFKQMIQSKAMQYCQLDACRLGGLNEVLLVMLMAAKHDVPLCPHAGGVGLCEYINHIIMIDYIAIAGSAEGRVAEYVDHLHEHFLAPCQVQDAHYTMPMQAGYGVTLTEEALNAYQYPGGSVWRARVKVGEV